jgi:glycosyltransferase involved in cell wall biosynthesis
MEMKILIISPRVLIPPRSGYAIRLLSLIKGLSQNNKIDLVAINFDALQEEDIAELRKYCQNVFLASWRKRSKLQQVWPIMKKFMKKEPFFTKYVESEDLKKLVYNLSHKEKYQIIIVEHSVMATYFHSLHPKHGAKTVLDMYDICFSKYHSMYRYENNIFKKIKLLLSWLPLRKWEAKMASFFDMVITVSEPDKKLILSRMPNCNVMIVANGVDTKTHRPFPREGRGENIFFVGAMDYEPNVDAILYFCNEIFNLIKKNRPNCTLIVVGKSPPAQIIGLNKRPGIMIVGEVEDVKPFYKKSLISVVPLRSGGGTRLKILEAMALGTPVVSTSIGCEGLHVENNRNILIADNPADFAQQITNLLTDVELWNWISQNGRSLVEGNYDWEKISSEYWAILEELAQRP